MLQTVYPVDNVALDDGNHQNTEASTVVVHQLKHVHATLQRQTRGALSY